METAQFLVLVQQGFTFCRIDDNERHLGFELDSRWKAAAPGPHNAEFLKTVGRRGRSPRLIDSRLSGKSRHTGSTSKSVKNPFDSGLNCTVCFKIIQDCSKASNMRCLIPNIGSTSFKYRVLDMPAETVLAEGLVERIGQPGGECPDYQSAIAKCLATIAGEGKALGNLAKIGAVGFKAVHAGPLNQSQLIVDELLRAMEEFTFFAPAHNPP
jgi:hypothetical protein